MTITELLKQAQQQLVQSETALLDAQLLLARVLAKPRSYLIAYGDQPVKAATQEAYQYLLDQRQQNYPIAYLLGEKEFWSLRFKVTPDVLIPRPETELLVEKILDDHPDQATLTVIDLGTGSGVIAIALAHERPHWKIIASEVSEKALVVAQANAVRLSPCGRGSRKAAVRGKLTFLHSHWFDQFPKNLKN